MKQVCTLADGKPFEFWEQDVKYTSELFVDGSSAAASDDNDGSRDKPFKTIQAAADIAVPGTHIWIAPGEYREFVSPMRGGDGPDSMICYEAVEKGTVVIKASEVVTDFEESTDWRRWGHGGPTSSEGLDAQIWCHRLSPDMFRGYNPFCAVNILHDRLFIEYDKTDMTPYLNRR